MNFAEELAAEEQARQAKERLEFPPEILAFDREIRETFGEGVKLYLDTGPWIGGVNMKAKPGFFSRRIRKLFGW